MSGAIVTIVSAACENKHPLLVKGERTGIADDGRRICVPASIIRQRPEEESCGLCGARVLLETEPCSVPAEEHPHWRLFELEPTRRNRNEH